jgi:hypothetical protein
MFFDGLEVNGSNLEQESFCSRRLMIFGRRAFPLHPERSREDELTRMDDAILPVLAIRVHRHTAQRTVFCYVAHVGVETHPDAIAEYTRTVPGPTRAASNEAPASSQRQHRRDSPKRIPERVRDVKILASASIDVGPIKSPALLRTARFRIVCGADCGR